MKSAWIVVAHRAGARIFERRSAPREFLLIAELDNAEGRLKNTQLETDRPGMARGQGGHGMNAKHSAHEHVATKFAAQIAEVLRTARNEHRIDRIVLMAEPHFLGMLRNSLDDVTRSLVVETVPKDLAGMSLAQTKDYLLAQG